MDEIQVSRTQKIIALHEEFLGYFRMSLDVGIRLGGLLTEQKKSLNFGEWLPYVRDNLPFTDRAARNYMKLYREREKLKSERVSDLTSAYKLLARGDIELECRRGRHIEAKYGTSHCIDWCHGQCGDFGYGINLIGGGLCGHENAHKYGRPAPEEWRTAYRDESERREEEGEYYGWCADNYIWIPTMSACPKDKLKGTK